MFRVGQGFDVHALALHRKCMIGGVQIPFEKGPVGVTDGDPLLHAIIDALLGAAAMGDIGQRFPASEEAVQQADSGELLRTVVKEIYTSGFTIGNIDCTILAEEPKVGPFIQAMRQRMSELCEVELAQINIKATTMEQMGFIGRKEGIGAMATVLLQKKQEKEAEK